MRFLRLYSLVHFWTTFWSRFSWCLYNCRAGSATEAVLVGDSSGSPYWPFAAWQEGIYLRVAFSYPKLTSMAATQPTVGSLGFPKHFLEGVFYFFSRFQGLGSLFSDAQHVYTKTTLTLTFVKLVVGECRAPLKSLVCHARLWTIHGYPDVSKNFLIPSQPSPMSGGGLLLNSKQFSDFLVSLSPPKYISSCTSDDVIKFW